jgi:hypothetical protein
VLCKTQLRIPSRLGPGQGARERWEERGVGADVPGRFLFLARLFLAQGFTVALRAADCGLRADAGSWRLAAYDMKLIGNAEAVVWLLLRLMLNGTRCE